MATLQGGEAHLTGWPLGLQPVNLRVRLVEHFGWVDRNASLDVSPSVSSSSSSDLDTESTMSFFPDRSMTLGSLIGIRADARRRNPSRNAAEAPEFESSRREGRTSRLFWSLLGRKQAKSSRSRRLDDRGGGSSSSTSLGQALALERSCCRSRGRDDDHVYINVLYEEASSNNPLFEDSPPLETASTSVSGIIRKQQHTSWRLRGSALQDYHQRTLSTICGCIAVNTAD